MSKVDTKPDTKQESKISHVVTDLAKELGKHITYEDDKMHISAIAYLETLPEGITKEIIADVHKHNSHFYPAATLAFGHAAEKTLKANKKLDEVTLNVPMYGKDSMDLKYSRSKEMFNPSAAEGSPKTFTRYGYVEAKLVVQSARQSLGAMGHVRSELAAEAMKAFGK
jgi:hypothetical protein